MWRTTIHFDRPRRRGLKWVGGTLVAAAAVVAALMPWHGRAGRPPAVTHSVAPAQASAPQAVTASLPAFDANGGQPAKASAAADLCEQSVLPLPGSSKEANEEREAARYRSTVASAQVALRARGDDLSLAAAYVLSATSGDLEMHAAAQQDLARLAQASSDPRVYAMAYAGCHDKTIGNCQLLSAEHWARLDPDDGTPWYYIASKALRGGDGAAADAAMRRLIAAPRLDDGDWSPLEAVIGPDPVDPAAISDTMRLAMAMLSARYASLPPMTVIFEYCFGRDRRESTPAIPARVPTCQRLSEALGTRSNTVLERSMGAALGVKLGMPEATQVRDEMRAIRTFASEALTTSFDCAGMKHQTAQIREALRWGEIPSILRAIEASDTPMARRAERARALRQQEAAASAALQASGTQRHAPPATRAAAAVSAGTDR